MDVATHRTGKTRAVEAEPLVVLVDDVRSFRDGRACRIARSAEAALQLLAEMRDCPIDELWLDYDLGGDTTVLPVVQHLVDAALAGQPIRVGRVRVHSSNSSGAHQIVALLRRAGYPVERDYNRAIWTW
jgi:hypothetical protein